MKKSITKTCFSSTLYHGRRASSLLINNSTSYYMYQGSLITSSPRTSFYSTKPSPPGTNPNEVPPPQAQSQTPPSNIPESQKSAHPNVVPPAAHVGAAAPDSDKFSHSKPSIEFPDGHYLLPHPIWSNEYVNKVEVKHHPRKTIKDWLAWVTIRTIRFNFDWMTGFMFKAYPTASDWCTRLIFLETIAAVPGNVGGTLRHLRSLRNMRRDFGWIHTLMEEAENERMHLMTFITLKKPGPFMRTMVFLAQGIFFNFYFVMYVLSSTYCHRLVGYLEEEAVKTYTKLLKQIDEGKLPVWRDMIAPEIARDYWKMDKNATMRDVIALIRADEAHHRDVNHKFATLEPNMPNPFAPGF